MTKDGIIKLAENLKHYCEGMRCEECKFFTDAGKEWCCEIFEFTKLFASTPCGWDIKKIKELL